MLTLQNRSYLLYKIHDINLANWSDGFCKLIGLIINPPDPRIPSAARAGRYERLPFRNLPHALRHDHPDHHHHYHQGSHFATYLMLRVMINMICIYHGHHNHDHHDHPHNHHHYHHGSYFATRLLLPPPLSAQCSNFHSTTPNGWQKDCQHCHFSPLDGNHLSDSWQPECIQTAFKNSVIDHQLISCALIVYLNVWSLHRCLSHSYTRKNSP